METTQRDYTPEQVAEILGVHKDTVYRWLKEFKGRQPILGGYRLPGSKSGWRITPGDLTAFRVRYHNLPVQPTSPAPEDVEGDNSRYSPWLRHMSEDVERRAADLAAKGGKEQPFDPERFKAKIAELQAGLADLLASVAEPEADKEKPASPETTGGQKG